MKVTLPGPGDHYAELYESDTIPEGRWRKVKRLMLAIAQEVGGLEGSETDQMRAVLSSASPDLTVDIDATVAAAFLRSWSLDLPPTRESLEDELPRVQFMAIVKAAGAEMVKVVVNDQPTDDRASPTGPSSG